MKGSLLDLGCGNKPYSVIYNDICDSSVGCDVPFSLHKDANVEVLCYAEDIDMHFKSCSFDCIICTEVLEHTVNDQKVILNAGMILKEGGHLLISAPFTYVMHEPPHDFRRYTFYGLKDILERNNFQILSAFSMGATFSSGLYIFYSSIMKIFYFILKKAGLRNASDNSFLRAITSFPEYLFYKLYISFFRKKLRDNKPPSTNEIFSSLGYFFVARKLNDKPQ
ncbi:MAG: methyltransferase domain-containing protein [Ignavibacteria bacterium]|nr:methyltransferase domain-containing protein [Ignavibacteria bacterium]